MFLDLNSKKLYTDKGQLIKQMFCPKTPSWEEFNTIDNEPFQRNCNHCKHAVVDTNFFTEKELIEMVKNDASVCFKVSLDQKNVTIIEDDNLTR